jgi:hypothetical protein
MDELGDMEMEWVCFQGLLVFVIHIDGSLDRSRHCHEWSMHQEYFILPVSCKSQFVSFTTVFDLGTTKGNNRSDLGTSFHHQPVGHAERLSDRALAISVSAPLHSD